MRSASPLLTVAALASLWLSAATAVADQMPAPAPAPPGNSGGPRIELAPPEEPQSGIPRPPALRLLRESQIEIPLNQPATTGLGIGGYGELTFNAELGNTPVVDLRRLVLYFGQNFTERIRLYTEIEIEHAISSAEDRGEIEVEQAFLDFLLFRPLNLRAGLILMPVGIVNIYHEPTTFHSVDRPDTDTLIIPSTWREPGVGLFGAFRSLRYQLYVVNGFNATGFTPDMGLRDGHQEAQLALGRDWGLVARLDWEPVLGTVLGASYYYANADQGQDKYLGPHGEHVSVMIAEADLRSQWRGLQLRGEIASVWIGDADRVSRIHQEAATLAEPFAGPVAHNLLGGYVEVGYNVLRSLHLSSGMSLTPFLRYEHTDTQFTIPTGFDRAPGNRRDTFTAGLAYRPIAEVAIKFDYQRRWTDAMDVGGATVDRLNAALAFMF